jgi:hypothetical protein
MAVDYYPLIARVVTGLDENTGHNRRALYNQARVALLSQLRRVVPALDEADITRERLALEEAIRLVEVGLFQVPKDDSVGPLIKLARLIEAAELELV